jgi:hypothetical protein
MKKVFLITTVVSLTVIAVSAWFIFPAVRMPSPGFGPHRNSRESARFPVPSDTTAAVRVAVLNGCGKPGVVSRFVRCLRERGFDVVNGMGGNADSFDFPRSVVVDRRGNRACADSVARCLGIRAVLDQRSENPYLIEDVAVILGRDWETLPIPEKEKAE